MSIYIRVGVECLSHGTQEDTQDVPPQWFLSDGQRHPRGRLVMRDAKQKPFGLIQGGAQATRSSRRPEDHSTSGFLCLV